MKHTPEPWQVDGDGKSWLILAPGFTVAMNNETDSESKPEESMANAHLIASAPELLRVCKGALLAIEELQKEYQTKLLSFNLAPDYLRQAIAKAEGKTNDQT